MPPLNLYARVRFFVQFCTRDRGCSVHPVFPVPSDQEGKEISGKPRAYQAARSRSCVSTSLPCMRGLPKAVQTCLIRLEKSASRNARAARSSPRGDPDMTIMMPAPDQAVLARRDAIVKALRAMGAGPHPERPRRYLRTHPEERRLRRVSKDGGESNCCGHPSRRLPSLSSGRAE